MRFLIILGQFLPGNQGRRRQVVRMNGPKADSYSGSAANRRRVTSNPHWRALIRRLGQRILREVAVTADVRRNRKIGLTLCMK